MFVSAKGKQQKQVRHLQCQEQCIDHIPYYLSGLSCFSRNSCIQGCALAVRGGPWRCSRCPLVLFPVTPGAVPGGPWRLPFALGKLENLTLFM